MDKPTVDELAEYMAATIGIPWDGLTPQQQDNYRGLAQMRIDGIDV
jgi:hypothetical protein